MDHLPNQMDSSYLITWRDGDLDAIQRFSYFAKEGKLSFRFLKSIVLHDLDVFGADLADELPISNLIVQQGSYLESLREFLIPNRTNLYAAPGYSNGRVGYIEGVSAEMWLGESLWRYVKCTKQALLEQDWLYCEDRASHLYVRAWPEPFSSAEGEQGEIQRRLLGLLFGISRRTPPPLPPPLQDAFVQKVLVVGENVRDQGVDVVCADGTRIEISPPEPAAVTDYVSRGYGEIPDMEESIHRFLPGKEFTEEQFLAAMLNKAAYTLLSSPDKPNTCASMRNPENGEVMIAVFSSQEQAAAALSSGEVPERYHHISRHLCCKIFQACKGDIGVFVNPGSRHSFSIAAKTVQTIRSLVQTQNVSPNEE